VKLHVLPAGPILTNAYLLTDAALGQALLIDAPGGIWGLVQPILEQEKCALVELWLTHGHWDHTQGAAEVVRASGARVRGHPADRRLFEDPGVMSDFLGEDLGLEPVGIDEWLEPGKPLSILGRKVEVRHVPGHCPGNVLFHFPELRVAFVGDALFKGSVGRTDLPGGDADILMNAIRREIYSLPPETRVFPGHGEPTTVGEEQATNPYVRA